MIDAAPLPAFEEKVEEELRTQAYTALVELSFAETREKAAIVERLTETCSELKNLIHGRSDIAASLRPHDARACVLFAKFVCDSPDNLQVG